MSSDDPAIVPCPLSNLSAVLKAGFAAVPNCRSDIRVARNIGEYDRAIEVAEGDEPLFVPLAVLLFRAIVAAARNMVDDVDADEIARRSPTDFGERKQSIPDTITTTIKENKTLNDEIVKLLSAFNTHLTI